MTDTYQTCFPSIPAVDAFSVLRLQVSNEDYGLEGLGALLDRMMPKLRISMSKAFQFVTTWNYAKPTVFNPGPLAVLLKRAQYTDIGHMIVAIPVSFKGNLHDYVVQFGSQQLPAVFDMVRLLDDVTKRFAGYVNDPESVKERYSPVVGNGMTSQQLTKLLDECKQREIKYANVGNRTGEQRLDVTFDSLSQIADTETKLNDINKSYWRSASPDLITEKVKRLNDTASYLFDAIEALGAVDKQVLDNLTSDIELVARWVEMYAVLIARLLDVNSSMLFTQDKLVKML